MLQGKVHRVGDNIDTDRIIPGKYTKTLDMSALADHVLEDVDPDFPKRIQPGDLLVAGANFGVGSSREQAPLALQAAGIKAVIATSFARIFFRNAINIGLPAIAIGEHKIKNGAMVSIRLSDGTVIDETAGHRYEAAQMPEVMIEILRAGGLVPYLKMNGGYG